MDNFGLTTNGFKRKTFNEVLESLETKAKEEYGEDVNLSERSPLGMFLKIIAWEFSNTWQALESSYMNSSALNANGTPLDDIVSNFGRKRFLATISKGKVNFMGEDGTKIPLGFVIGTKDDILFRTLNETVISDGIAIVDIAAINPGLSSNVPANTIVKIINPIAGVSEVINIKPTIGGSDIEKDNFLRERHFQALREPTTGDNLAQYKVWAKEVMGVGNVKVNPITPTRGYVTVIITDSNNTSASNELVNQVYDYIDKVKPVNAGLFVKSAIAKSIDISAKLNLAQGYNIQDVQDNFLIELENYLSSISLKESYVSYGQIGRVLLDTKGLVDYKDLTLNGIVANVSLSEEEIPAIGTIALEVVI